MREPMSNVEVERFRQNVAVLSRPVRGFGDSPASEYLLTADQLDFLLYSITNLRQQLNEARKSARPSPRGVTR